MCTYSNSIWQNMQYSISRDNTNVLPSLVSSSYAVVTSSVSFFVQDLSKELKELLDPSKGDAFLLLMYLTSFILFFKSCHLILLDSSMSFIIF